MYHVKIISAAAMALILCAAAPGAAYAADIEPMPMIEPMLTAEEITERIGGKGNLITPGMDPSDYQMVIDAPWNEMTFPNDAEPSGVTFSYDEAFTYSQWENILFDLAQYEDVRLFEIGETLEGRKIYSIEIGSAQKTVLLSAGVHAREIGGVYLLYHLLQNKAEEAGNSTEAHQSLTNDVKFAAVLIANPDGYTYYVETGSPIKSNNQYGDGKGVDINNNFPASYGGIRLSGVKTTGSGITSPATADYSGPSLGCAKETQALMRFYHKYIVEENSAIAYIDFHQQGRVVYLSTRVDKVDDTGPNRQFGQKLVDYLGYRFAPYGTFAGGGGGTTARMVMDYSLGFQMGRFGVVSLPVQGEALPLVLYRDIPNYLDYYPNKTSIPSITLEITTLSWNITPIRNVWAAKAEYDKYKYGEFLTYVADEAVKMAQER
ncbi:MAG: hypothetical protein LBT44_03695 [Clostridiales bacterium]|jgi:hypothetical protein|nr:hypothetical protein [Clostridiales bacterium]